MHGPREAAHRVSDARKFELPANQAAKATNAEGVTAAVLLLLALILGGGTRNYLYTDLAVQFASIPALLFALLNHAKAPLPTLTRSWVGVLVVIASLPLVFQLPIPDLLFSVLPGRAGLSALAVSTGLSPASFKPLSLDPIATLAVQRALLPALALGMLVPLLSHAWRRRLLQLIILAGIFTIPLGLAQINGGPHSPLRFYTPTNPHDAVGLFANRNHFAALLVAGLALTGAFLLEEIVRPHGAADYGRLRVASWLLLGAVLIFGLALSRSRAGVGLALLTLAGCAALGWRQLGSKALPWIAAAVALALLLGFQIGFVWIADRAQQFFTGDQRWLILSASLDLAREFGWLGVGPGAFPAAYAAYEPIAALGPRIVNHAHNDWLEWWIELGIVLPIVAAVFLRWLLQRSRALFAELRRQDAAAGAGQAPTMPLYLFGPWLAILMALAHAAFDYQLRTTTDLCVFVVCCACLVPSRQQAAQRVQRSAPRLVVSAPDGTDEHARGAR